MDSIVYQSLSRVMQKVGQNQYRAVFMSSKQELTFVRLP